MEMKPPPPPPPYRCPNRVVVSEYSDSGQEAMMCLVCGEMLCTNSYCCQHHVEGVDEETGVGGFTNHSQRYRTHSSLPYKAPYYM